jgi:hypothetical protein
MKKIIKLLTLSVFIFLSFFKSTHVSEASQLNNSLGISGPFGNYEYIMVPNETISHPNIFVRIFNNFVVDISIRLNYQAPENVSVELYEEVYTIPSGDYLQIDVSLTTTNTTPGVYRVFFGATVIPEVIQGISVTGTARLSAKLTILGEAGELNITTLTPLGNPIPVELNLYRVNGAANPRVPVRQTTDGTFNGRLAAGTYYVSAHYDDYLVAEETFTLAHLEDKVIVLIANIVQVTSFDVDPQYYEDETETNILGSIRATYAIQTLFEPLERVKIYMIVSLDDAFLEKTIIANILELGIGSFVFYQNFVPSTGWTDGEYTFYLEAYQVNEANEEVLFGQSDTDSATVTRQDLPRPPTQVIEVIPWWLIALLLIFTVAAVEIALVIQKRNLKVIPLASSSTQDACHQVHQELLKAVVTYECIDAVNQPTEKQDAFRHLQSSMEAFVACMNDRIHMLDCDPLIQHASDILKQNK